MAKDPKLDIATDESLNAVEETPQPKSYRMHILLILTGVVLAQATLLFFILPSPADTQNALKILETRQIVEGDLTFPPEAPPDPNAKKEEYVEKELGEKFSVQSIRPTAEQAIDTFTVTVVVRVFKKDATAYDKLFESKKFSIRQAVEEVLRASTLEERKQVTLITIKQRIMKVINEVLGEPYVRDVICIDPKPDMM